MNVILTLMRKHFIESRWTLGLSAAAFVACSVFAAWRIELFEHRVARGETGHSVTRTAGFLRLLGGENMDDSTTATLVCWWNHPVVVLTVLGWAVSRGSGAVSGEIERGTIDVTLSRPVGRGAYLTSQVVFAVLGLVVLTSALVGGLLASSLYYTFKTPPSLSTLWKPALMVVALGMAVFGYTLPLSSVDVVRWRPALVSWAVTLAGLFSLTTARMFEGYSFHDLMERVSVFWAYAPVTVAVKGDPLWSNTSALMAVFAAGVAVSYWAFSRRDLPSNS